MGEEQGADDLAGDDFRQHLGIAAVGDDHVFAGAGAKPGGLQLAGHAALAPATRSCRAQGRKSSDRAARRWRMSLAAGLAGVAVAKPIDVGKQHQERSPNEIRHDGRQPIVVAEGGLQLLDGNRIVFVDDRNGPKFQQGQERIPGVEVAGAVSRSSAVSRTWAAWWP